MIRTRPPAVLAIAISSVIAVAVGAGCASGQSILNAGNDPPALPPPPATSSSSPGGAPTTIRLAAPLVSSTQPLVSSTQPLVSSTQPLVPPTIVLPQDGFAAPAGGGDATGTNTVGAYAPCPVEALEAADGPVSITFWHTMTNVAEDALVELTDAYNERQDRVIVELSNQSGYEQLVDEYFQSGHDDRPHLVQMPDYMVQQMADANTVVPIGACIQTEEYDLAPLLPRALLQYQTAGVQWSMPFNMSAPVLYYNRLMFDEAGLDPDDPPVTLDEMRQYSQALVDSGAAAYGWAIDSGVSSGGGWFLEQWLARAGLPYSDQGNGRQARSTGVLFDAPEAVEMLSVVQSMVEDGLAVDVGGNTSGQDVLLKLADPEQPAAMGIATSAGLGTVLDVLGGGLIPDFTGDDVGVGPMPGPTATPSALVGGASLYIVRDKGDPATAAAWDFVKYLVSAEAQSVWAARTGYVPVNSDALDQEPLSTTYAGDPRFRVAYDEVLAGSDDVASVGPVLGPLREIRGVTAEMMALIYDGAVVEDALAAAADQADLLIADYEARN